MARTITTEAIESKTKVWSNFEIFDFFFLITYIGISYAFLGEVHDSLHVPFMIFSCLMAGFLTMKSPFNKKRRNYESLFFLIKKDTYTYKPIKSKEK